MQLLKTTLTAAIAICISMATINAQETDDSKVIKKEIDVEQFTNISVSGGWDLSLTQGDVYSMMIEASENSIEDFLTLFKEKKIPKKKKKGSNNRSKSKRNIHLTFKKLDGIAASGGCDLYFESLLKTDDFDIAMSGGSDLNKLQLEASNLSIAISGGSDAKINVGKVDKLNVAASGGSDVILTNINAQKTNIAVSGGSDAKISGESKESRIAGSGGSDIKADNFTTEICTINLSGASDGKMKITKELAVSLSSGSDFHCYGKPTLTKKDICKSCDLSRE